MVYRWEQAWLRCLELDEKEMNDDEDAEEYEQAGKNR